VSKYGRRHWYFKIPDQSLKESSLFIFQIAIPKERTSYLCTAFEIPKFNETHHMIEVGVLHLHYELSEHYIINEAN